MTPEQLMAIHPAELNKLSDAELGEKLAPLFPMARALYAGPREQVITLPTGLRTTKKSMDRTAQLLQQLVASTVAQSNQASRPADTMGPPTSFQTQPLRK